MSYILDALKKSEQEREQGAVPVLRTSRRIVSRRRRLWQGGLVGALVLISAAAGWFMGPRVYEAVVAVWSPAAPDGAAGPAASKPQTALKSSEPAAGEARGARQPAAPEPTAPRRVSTIDELDPAARARVEDLSVNVVSYTQAPERRFVMLNQRIVRESEAVGDGVVVKRIVPEGAVLAVGEHEILLRPE